MNDLLFLACHYGLVCLGWIDELCRRHPPKRGWDAVNLAVAPLLLLAAMALVRLIKNHQNGQL